MSSSWPKVIRDPVHNIVPFDDTPCDRLLLDLINSREFQRLRRVKQLGVSQLVFPGADHSRFAHSIGVMHVARRFLDRIARLDGLSLTEDQRIVVLAASLLHDVGHGPFSHAFEKITGEDHERRTLEIISDDSTHVNQILRKCSLDLPGRLQVFFDEESKGKHPASTDIPPFLTHVVSSQMDADRFDYLLRDSLATGTDYGRFDLEWLLQHLRVNVEKGRFYLSHKAVFAAENYVFARFHMYRTVYFHKTTRAGEVMLRLLFKRYKRLLDEAASPDAKQKVVSNAPPHVFRAFAGGADRMTLAEYLSLDDHSITEFLKCCLMASDKQLQQLAGGLLYRNLFKATDATHAESAAVGAYNHAAIERVRELGLDPDFAFYYDSPSDTPYKPYDPDAENPATQIYVETHAGGGQQELGTVLDAVQQLKRRYSLLRYYYPSEIRGEMEAVAAAHLK
jgi:hypothetical protein